jgi:hypothetical protein
LANAHEPGAKDLRFGAMTLFSEQWEVPKLISRINDLNVGTVRDEIPWAQVEPAPKLITDSIADFAGKQGNKGWFYGFNLGTDATFHPLNSRQTRGEDAVWFSTPAGSQHFALLRVGAREQRPVSTWLNDSSGNLAWAAVPVVRRWVSNRSGRVHLYALFQNDDPRGDGVDVSIRIQGHGEAYRATVGGQSKTTATYDAVIELTRGTAVDFVVDPGLTRNSNFAATQVAIQISEPPQPTDRRYQFPGQIEGYMAHLRDYRIDPLIILDFGNPAYDGGYNSPFRAPYTEEGRDGFARYATAVLDHFGEQIHAVEVWNEYNGGFCEGPAASEPSRATNYANLLKTAYLAIKRSHPSVTVAGASTVGVPLPFFERLFRTGALEFMDVVSVHPYRYSSSPEGIELEIGKLRALIEKYNIYPDGSPRPAKPIWVTEIGWFNKESKAIGDLLIDEETKARFLVRAYALLLSAGVERIYWFLFRDDTWFETMGLVQHHAPYASKPAFLAYQILINELKDSVFVRRENSLSTLYSILFRRQSGQEIRVLWALKPTTLELHGAIQITDIHGVAVTHDGAICLSDSPLFVEGPLTGLPPPNTQESTIADSGRDFSDQQGEHGWYYGFFTGQNHRFEPFCAKDFRVTDWKREWCISQQPYSNISITDQEQEPGTTDSHDVTGKAIRLPLAAVRRWVSDRAEPIKVHAVFTSRISEGDGVNVYVLFQGKEVFRATLGGSHPQAIVAIYDEALTVVQGATVDFVVDPGPTTNVNFDFAQVSIAITPAKICE